MEEDAAVDTLTAECLLVVPPFRSGDSESLVRCCFLDTYLSVEELRSTGSFVVLYSLFFSVKVIIVFVYFDDF